MPNTRAGAGFFSPAEKWLILAGPGKSVNSFLSLDSCNIDIIFKESE